VRESLSAALGGAAQGIVDFGLPPRPAGAEVLDHVGVEPQRYDFAMVRLMASATRGSGPPLPGWISRSP